MTAFLTTQRSAITAQLGRSLAGWDRERRRLDAKLDGMDLDPPERDLLLRIYSAERRVLPRHFVEVQTPHGKVHVKVGNDGAFAPEFEDCRRIAVETGAPLKDVMAEASFAYWNSRIS